MGYTKLLYFAISFLVLSICAYAQNAQPTADAGDDRNVVVNKEARLSGSGVDIDNDPLTFKWQLIEKPSGSLSDFSEGKDNIASPSFTPDRKGTYMFSLRTNDGNIFSIRSYVTINSVDEDSANTQPISYPGPNRNVNIGEETILTGFGSDGDGDGLLYIWSLLSSPIGSSAILSNPHVQSLPFTPDLEGEYLFSLAVNDGKGDGNPAEVKITASKDVVNRAPSADAGTNKTIKIGDVTTLAGTGSDPDMDPLTFTWAVIFKPVGTEEVTLSDNNVPNPSFTPNVEGRYIFGLTVDDGKLDSEPYIVMYEAQTPPAGNNKPTADAGADTSLNVWEEVELQGSGTDPDGDTLAFRWSITSMPAGSGAFLSNPNTQNPRLMPDVAGAYGLQLITNDNAEDSNPDSMNIDVAEPTETCAQGACDLNTKKWCNNGIWSDLNYCDKCGNQDSTCPTCTGNVCDINNQKWCENGLWKQGTYSQYCSHCNSIDDSCPICEDGTCDVANQKWCNNGVWSVIDYCDNCGNVDVSCGKGCLNNVCDTNSRRWCNNGAWKESDYCVKCGNIDSSCYFECLNNACDTNSRRWCNNGIWTNTDYCTHCGDEDVSCGVACQNNACDTTANRWCNVVFWATLDYCEQCQDSECVGSCTNNACDIDAKKRCNNGAWKETDYCAACGNRDSSCSVVCQENACDITSDKRCSNGVWESRNYCDYCGLKDSDCTIVCAEGECDEINKESCKNGEWTSELYDTWCVVKTCRDYGDCIIGDSCEDNNDCASGYCSEDECTKPRCDDSAENGDETDIDCGGNECPKCGNNKNCKANSDCSSDFCDLGLCEEVDTCSDGVLNGDEGDIDCGGTCPNKCRLGKACSLNDDCETGLVCYGQVCLEEEIPKEEAIVEEEETPDFDEDEILDEWELLYGLDPNNSLDADLDFDEDGLSNIQEYSYGTNPNKGDSDGDGVNDKKEIDEGTDPLDLESRPKGILGALILIIVVLIIFGVGSYGAYYYFTKRTLQEPLEAKEEGVSFIPARGSPKPQQKRVLRKTPDKRAGVIEKRREEKREKRGKLLKAFGKGVKPKERKKLISIAKEEAEIEKIRPGKKK